MPWHLQTIEKSGLLKTWESHLSLVWVMELSTIPTCLGKSKVFSNIIFQFFNVLKILKTGENW